jgi:hypothetical protein
VLLDGWMAAAKLIPVTPGESVSPDVAVMRALPDLLHDSRLAHRVAEADVEIERLKRPTGTATTPDTPITVADETMTANDAAAELAAGQKRRYRGKHADWHDRMVEASARNVVLDAYILGGTAAALVTIADVSDRECHAVDILREYHRRRAAEADAKLAERERTFPVQPQRDAKPHHLNIPWSVAELAYSVYAGKYGGCQSLDRLAERGGFGPGEMDIFLPDWRDRCDEITNLRAKLAEAEKRIGELEKMNERLRITVENLRALGIRIARKPKVEDRQELVGHVLRIATEAGCGPSILREYTESAARAAIRPATESEGVK